MASTELCRRMFSKLKAGVTTPLGILSHQHASLTMGHTGDIIHTPETYIHLRVAAGFKCWKYLGNRICQVLSRQIIDFETGKVSA